AYRGVGGVELLDLDALDGSVERVAALEHELDGTVHGAEPVTARNRGRRGGGAPADGGGAERECRSGGRGDGEAGARDPDEVAAGHRVGQGPLLAGDDRTIALAAAPGAS